MKVLCICKALQLRRELILLAGYLPQINIIKFMIADRVAFRRTAGQVCLCSLTCNGDCYHRSSATRVIVVVCCRETEPNAFLIRISDSQRLYINEPSKIRTNDRIKSGLIGSGHLIALATAPIYSFPGSNISRKHLFAKAQYVHMRLEGEKKNNLLLFIL